MAQVNRLVAFGCSLTYGHGLADCYLPDGREGPHPSIQAWPFHVARHFKYGLVNEGIPGGSNKQIFHTIKNYQFKKHDGVIILWSYLNRSCSIYPEYIDKFGPWISSTKSKAWVKNIFNDYDSNLELLTYQEYLEMFFRQKSIPVCFYYIDHYMPVEQPTNKYFHRAFADFARDGKHPGAKTQHEFANQVILDPSGPLNWSKDTDAS